MDSSTLMVLGIIIGIVVYFIPTVVAFVRGRVNKGAIFCMNLFLGWSFIGWVVALIWAVKEPENGGK
jgi:tryptophan-rich sensory protein